MDKFMIGPILWALFITFVSYDLINWSLSVEAVDEVKIGILIKHRGLEVPLNDTLRMLELDKFVLPSTKLIATLEFIENENSYQASVAVCRLLSQGVWAIIGPQSILLTPIIQSITAHHNVPLILMSWQPKTYYLNGFSHKNHRKTRNHQDSSDDYKIPESLNYTINLHPQADQLSQAYLDLIRYKGWRSFSLIYESSQDFVLVKDVLETSLAGTRISFESINLGPEILEMSRKDIDSDNAMTQDKPPNDEGADSGGANQGREEEVRQITYCDVDDGIVNSRYSELVKSLRKNGIENIVLSMPLGRVCKVLREAARFDMLSTYIDYIIANVDGHLLDLTHLQPFMANISSLSILEPDGQQKNFSKSLDLLGQPTLDGPKEVFSTEYALMSDAVSLVAYSIHELLYEGDRGKHITGPSGECSMSKDAVQPWPDGQHLMAILKNRTRVGHTGIIKFDRFGQRVDFNLKFILYNNNAFKKVGTWNPHSRLAERSKSTEDIGREAIRNQTLKVIVAITTPYVMRKENYMNKIGNDRYEGYCIDLMNRLADDLGFTYVIQERTDGKYGNPENGSWNGMVRDLLDWKADLAIVDLTINKDRQSVVDFTHPFMTLGISIIYKKPKIEEAEMYSFLMPFSKQVWLSMWSAYLATSLTLWLISRLSPIEWHNPHPCFDDPDEKDLENEIHSIGASLWFTIGSLMQQGSDLAPRSPSVRALASVWYFFTLILISSYTANFAAFLTASRMQSPIESAEDLAKQTKIDYGCKDGGTTKGFFANSNHSTYRRMWNFMESRKHQGVFPKDNDQGISMVKKRNFAFLMESTSIEYKVQRDCELTQIGGLLDHKGYGIALRKRSPFRAPLSKQIVNLTETGYLQDLKNRWWNAKQPICEEDKESALATSELGIDKLGGVFVLLGGGVGLAFCMAFIEFIWGKLKVPRDERNSIRAMLWGEILRISQCGASKRPRESSHYV